MLLLGGAVAAAAPLVNERDIDNSTTPVVDLGSAGSYSGIIQNNGKYVGISQLPIER